MAFVIASMAVALDICSLAIKGTRGAARNFEWETKRRRDVGSGVLLPKGVGSPKKTFRILFRTRLHFGAFYALV